MFGSSLLLLLVIVGPTNAQYLDNAQQTQQNFIRQIQPVQPFQDLGFGSTTSFTEYEGNLVRYGEEFGDRYISDNQRQNGLNIRLHNFFPFYGGRYNYTLISTNGYISFAYFSDDSSTLQLGNESKVGKVLIPECFIEWKREEEQYRLGLLSYTMINYYKLGFDAADMYGNSRTGKCQAIFNGGNHTGSVQVDLSEITKQQPSSLASRSAVPHITRGRYFHRTDDVVRPAGCGNKTGGTFPLLIYPNIVTMLGQTKVDVNGMCLNPAITYVLMIEQRQMAKCDILNPSIARCTLPKILDWGTKTVYFQPQSGLSNDEKAYVGFIYFVPPTLDPMRLDIGNIHSWYINPPPAQMTIKWYPRNFTAPRTFGEAVNYFDDSIYNVQLGLYVVGYKEAQDENLRKFVPQHRVLARLATYQNRVDEQHRWNPMIETYQLDRVDEWYLSRYEMHEELFTYRFGYLKLAPMVQTETQTTTERGRIVDLPEGMISAPISLHWLWTLPPEGEFQGNKQDKQEKLAFVKEKSREMCHEWFNEDGALSNFIRETETNSSCPCKEEQAKMDLGRFMPHPRCSAVPGLSTFHHDIMPYYLCCKFADFRCQLFYWRRPSSACQAYEPAVSGSILGAGIVSTLNNRNFIFNEPGIFTLLHSHRTSSTPEVQIQVRMERFPDRSVDFGALNIAQRDLVQPTNATVITGVVLSSESADRSLFIEFTEFI
ncbi:AMOP domain protein [Teladorsagia circumcincta]|uniref:AMOP domain protein n=2 Tax=Teladorsagia circumcincta TaxID=45464 RepID=A0A2G9V2Y4_TELCI|nr:AMOP domain protein [Teladorsagia circumcincta]